MATTTRVAGNHIEGSDSCSLLYDRDGAVIDIYGGQRKVIHHNVAVDNNAFLEVGRNQHTHRIARDTKVAYKDVRSRLKIANFLAVRGPGQVRSDTWHGCPPQLGLPQRCGELCPPVRQGVHAGDPRLPGQRRVGAGPGRLRRGP